MSRHATDLDAALDRCRIANGSTFRLAEFDTADLCGFEKGDKQRGKPKAPPPGTSTGPTPKPKPKPTPKPTPLIPLPSL